jgi:hypothetical protein
MKRFMAPMLGVAGALFLAVGIFAAGGMLATRALASSPFVAGPQMMGAWGRGDHGAWASQLPPEVRGLADIPAADRFDHFKGVTVNLTDKNNQSLAVTVTPGTVTAISSNSLSLAANDGSTRTYTLDANTIEKDKRAPLANQKAVVVTLNGSTTAAAVFSAPPQGAGPHGH